MDALVTDVQLPNAVAGLRGLGWAGYQPVALGDSWSAGGLWSRRAACRAVGPTAATDPLGFSATVERLVKTYGPLVIYPGWDGSIPAILEKAAVVSEAMSPYPGTAAEVLHRLRDKRQLPRLAALGGLEAPATLLEGCAKDIPVESIPFPCVVKPIFSGGHPSTARVVASRAALDALLTDVEPTTELLIQDFVRGELVMLALILDRDHSPVACFQQVARRVWPHDAGGTSAAVSVPPDQLLMAGAADMLAAVGFSGLAQLDLIERAGRRFLIDINPRYYTSMPLALACGVNLAAIWHAVVVGDRIPPCRYRAGVNFRWLEADMRAAIHGAPRVLAERVPRPRVGAMWAWDDLAPGPLLFMRATRAKWTKLLGAKEVSRL